MNFFPIFESIFKNENDRKNRFLPLLISLMRQTHAEMQKACDKCKKRKRKRKVEAVNARLLLECLECS